MQVSAASLLGLSTCGFLAQSAGSIVAAPALIAFRHVRFFLTTESPAWAGGVFTAEPPGKRLKPVFHITRQGKILQKLTKKRIQIAQYLYLVFRKRKNTRFLVTDFCVKYIFTVFFTLPMKQLINQVFFWMMKMSEVYRFLGNRKFL